MPCKYNILKLKSSKTSEWKNFLMQQHIWSEKDVETRNKKEKRLCVEKNPEGQSSAINIFLVPIDEVHGNIEGILHVLFKSAITDQG